MELGSSWWYPVKEEAAVGTNYQKFHLNITPPVVYCEGQAVEQVTQRDCGVSMLGNIPALDNVLGNLLY